MIPFHLRCVIWIILHTGAVVNWAQEDEWKQPRQIVNATQIGLRFTGNHTEPDHFKLLERDGDYLLVGARDLVYNISIKTFLVEKPILWPSTEGDVNECRMKGKTTQECHNYIRVLAKDGEHGVLVCGTNAFKPKCRVYSIDKDGNYASVSEFPGNAISPYDPSHNSTAVYVADRKEIFSGTVTDFGGADPVIYKHMLAKPNELGVRTERSDVKCLNNPDFVSSFSDKNHVYFWFREGAVEYMSCGKAVYSRVARVCKNDLGGPRGDRIWTSFLKARLNCSAPGDFPYYFDEIEATTPIISGSSQAPLVYAIFNTPYNAIRATAVCAFSMDEIGETFSEGSFKAQPSANANWMPIPRSQVPSPRPGNCEAGDSRQISDETATFMKKNPLMEDAIPNYFNEPLFIQSATRSRFTQIAVHSQVPTADGQKYDVIFVGTDTGKVLKMVNVGYGRQVNTVMVEIVHVFGNRAGIKNMLVYDPDTDNPVDDQFKPSPPGNGSLIVVSDNEVRSLPLHYCGRSTTCLNCVRMQDPYCAWDLRTSTCVGITNGAWMNGDFVQNVKSGQDQNRRCPMEEYENGMQIDETMANSGAASRPTFVSPSIDEDGYSNSLDSNPLHVNNVNSNSSFFESVEKHTTDERRTTADHLVDSSVTREHIREANSGFTVSQSQFAVAVVATLFVSLAVGFFGGVIFSNRTKLQSKMKKQKGVTEKYPPKSYTNHAAMPNGISKTSAPIHAFEATPKFIANEETGGEVEITLGDCDKSMDENSVNNYNSFTLPKDYKVKKMYL